MMHDFIEYFFLNSEYGRKRTCTPIIVKENYVVCFALLCCVIQISE